MLEFLAPRNQTEPQAIVDHREPATRELGRTDQATAYLAPRPWRVPSAAMFLRKSATGVLDLAVPKLRDEILRRADVSVSYILRIRPAGGPPQLPTLPGRMRKRSESSAIWREWDSQIHGARGQLHKT